MSLARRYFFYLERILHRDLSVYRLCVFFIMVQLYSGFHVRFVLILPSRLADFPVDPVPE